MEQLLRIATFVIALASLVLVSACGNKGDLYIPEPPPQAQSAETLPVEPPPATAQPVEAQPGATAPAPANGARVSP